MRRTSAFFAVALTLSGITGCSSSGSTSPINRPLGPPETFSIDLNRTSIFMGASIIQFWPLPLHNGGIGGQTTSEVLARFKSEVVGHGYERVIILCGTNDVLQNTPNLVTEISANLKSMGEIATEAGLEVVLSELPPAVWAGMDLSPTISAVNASIAQLAKEQGYLLVDYFSPMSGHPEFFPDGVHPSPTGYAVMEKALSAIVVQ
jgi:lysophospholipase L1-like esterase